MQRSCFGGFSFYFVLAHSRLFPNNLQAVLKQYTGVERHNSFHRDVDALLAINDSRLSPNNDVSGHLLWPEHIDTDEQQRLLVTRPLAKPLGEQG